MTDHEGSSMIEVLPVDSHPPAPPRMSAMGRTWSPVGGCEGGSGPVPVLTLVLWVGCLGVGLLGAVLPFQRPGLPRLAPPPVTATLLKVELTDEAVPSTGSPAGPTVEAIERPPPAPDPIEAPSAPPLVAVAEPAARIAFELPVESPARVVPAAEAASTRSTAAAETSQNPSASASTSASDGAAAGVVGGSGPVVQTLSFGQGEGRQPAPVYPREAVRERQEGVVVVRLTVDPSGRVVTAEVASPSPWPLLNGSALRAVRERWQFRPGPPRLYEVPIRFELSKA